MEKLYLECNSGISGDMAVAALLDLGADKEVLMKALNSIEAEGFEIKISKVKKSGLDCMDFDVVLDAHHDGHDHDMEYLYGHLHGDGKDDNHYQEEEDHIHQLESHHSGGNVHIHQAENTMEHAYTHFHHHEHRGMAEINAILDKVDMTPGARELTDRIFNILSLAESKAHGVPQEMVHFHEVGAIDSIVDIVAVAVCLDNLGIKEVVVPALYDGHGTVRCQHGILPVPVPAVANIVADAGISLHILDTHGELVTPTGAAIVAACRTTEKLPEAFKIKKIGLGAGKRDTGLAGFVRAMIIE